MFDWRRFDANRRDGWCKLAAHAYLQIKQTVELRVRKKGPEENTRVRTADAVDAAMALHQTHRVPRQVIVDDVAAILQVHAFSENIGCQEKVKTITFRARFCRGR